VAAASHDLRNDLGPHRQASHRGRDSLGVPHILADSFEDAIFLQGFVTAQDRMWQMDALRRLAAGELSEVIGKAGIEFDGESRRLRMRKLAEDHLRDMPAADRAVLAAYARGVNHFIETHAGRWGLEFALLRYDPKPWSAVDTMLAGLQMYRTLTNSWKLEVQKQTLRQGGDAAKVDVLYPIRSGLEFTPGSNAWALSGKLTASGKPILANDPHLDFAMPATWYQVHIGAPGVNVSGVSLPGVPCVIIGHNDRIAWGITNLHFDVQDLYREQFNPNNGQYLFRGAVERARAEPQVIVVKGDKPVSFTTWVTRHGPVFLNEGGQFYSLRWTAAEPGGFQFPFADLNRARDWQQFNAAIQRMPGPGSNFVYADVEGNIGYHAAGMLPVRRSFNGDLPVDGASGEYEWDGFIPYEELPSAYNPPSGMIVSANQNPFPSAYPHRVTGDFAPNFRAQQIRAALSRRGQWKPEEMLVIQKDVYASFSHSLAKQLVAAYDKRKASNPALAGAVDVLRGWDGQMDKDAAAPLIVTMAFQQLRSAIADAASPKKGEVYTAQVSPAVIDGLLRERPKGWFADWDQALVKALADGVEFGAKLQGGNPAIWKYGKYNELAIRHPVANELPLAGKYFNIGPVFMSGSSTTIKQTTQRLGPSMRFVADLSNWENSLNNITIGQSGHFFSSHYKDQWRSYWVGSSYPMQFGKVKADATLTVNPLK
jgi:penicillin amidase